MKQCTQCKIEKPLTEFSKNKRRKGGLQAECKACTQKRRAAKTERDRRVKYADIEAKYGKVVKGSHGVTTETHRKCSHCAEWLPHADFVKNSHKPFGIDSICLPCQRDYLLRKTYGIGLEDYEQMLVKQAGGCAICGSCENKSGKSLAVDHDHATGKVRGLLCDNCNVMLGHAKDDTSLLRRGIQYLEGHS